jgi:deoxyribodipyrimidine photolyase-related protein
MRNLIIVLGDQLDDQSAAFDEFDSKLDAVWMAEVAEEATYVKSHKQRLVFFFSAMRHFRDLLLDRDIRVHYHALTARSSQDRGSNFAEVLSKDLKQLRPQKLVMVLPGDFRALQQFQTLADKLKIALEMRPDQHFYCSPEQFAQFADGRKTLVLETFYRQQRQQHDVLMNGDEPAGGTWNFDQANREPFSKQGPGKLKGPKSFRPDALTQQVFELVESRFAEHPGTLEDFNLPVTKRQAHSMLRHFVKHALPMFGKFEDAMWSDEPFIYHSRLSAPLNIKLLNPRTCVEAAVTAYIQGAAPLNSVEGFVRQILGWREFIRGIYWLKMPAYQDHNFFQHQHELPSFYWDGKTDMQCVSQSMQHVLQYGYAHHIHRLMVLGNFSLLLGVDPYEFHRWHMSMYVDAVDWVSLPNTLGMSQFGDGGVVGTKPYVSTGNYINKMSNFCKSCRYNFKNSTGEDACPITTLYWDFLDRHHDLLAKNHRMAMQMKNVDRKRTAGELKEIRSKANQLKKQFNI